MSQPKIITSPATYVTPFAVGFSDPSGALALVRADAPLPVVAALPVAPAAVAGEADTSRIVGPFEPSVGVPIHLQLGGEWSGTVTLQRSTDGGVTRFPLTVAGQPWAQFTGNANEVVWQEGEAGASFWLDIVLGTGAVAYRISQ